MNKERFYLSTIDPCAGELAAKHGLGVEIAEFCTAWNMDVQLSQTDAAVRAALAGVKHRVLHAPFNELFPCAIDPKARQLAAERYRQALALCRVYGAEKMIVHGSFLPKVYYPIWFVEQSVLFWREFLRETQSDVCICLENVLEPEPELLLEIAQQVDDPRLGLCLDLGHVNAYSARSAESWIDCWGPLLRHTHVHNNNGSADTHSGPEEGTLELARLLRRIDAVSPQASFTLELPRIGSAVEWLKKKEIL